MQQNRLSVKQQQAAILVAEDELPDEEIAAKVAVNRTTVHRWKGQPLFIEAVEAHKAKIADKLERYAIARRMDRMEALDDRWKRMKLVVDERAADSSLDAIPGGSSGLIIRQLKQIGAGKDAQVVEEYVVDTGLLRELREHEKQAAQEAGQWTEKRDVTSGGKSLHEALSALRGATVEIAVPDAISDSFHEDD